MMHRAVNIIKESSAEEEATEEETTQEETTQDVADTSPHPTIERASAAFLAAAERLLSKLSDALGRAQNLNLVCSWRRRRIK
jgi:RNA polymerase-binding transcription factor DksA